MGTFCTQIGGENIMMRKDYSSNTLVYEQFIDISFMPNGQHDYTEVVTMWRGDFSFIVDLIPLNDEGMYVGLAFHYQVDRPWEANEEEPWEIDSLELTLEQLLYVKKRIHEMKQASYSEWDMTLVGDICDDICEIVKKAESGQGKAFITYY